MKRLYRSRQNRILGGVCGGIAEHYNIDPIIVRIIFGALGLAYSVGFWLYILCWIFLPLKDDFY